MNNREIIETYTNALWNDHQLTSIDDYFSPEVLIESPLKKVTGITAYKDIVQSWLTAFPDLRVPFRELTCEGNTVVSRWQSQGTHRGDFQGIAATNKTVTYDGVTIYQLSEGRVCAYWALVDMHKLLQQLTLV